MGSAARLDLLAAGSSLHGADGCFGSLELAVSLGLLEPWSAVSDWSQPPESHRETEAELEHLVADGLLEHERRGGGLVYHLSADGRAFVASLGRETAPVGRRSRRSALAGR